MRASPPALKFTADDADAAWDEWGANCGPGAIAAVCGLSLAELRPHLRDFEQKGYTNPTLMWRVLDELAAGWVGLTRPGEQWPQLGVVRIQWHGPWMAPGVPARAQYSHTHWIACCDAVRPRAIFDINHPGDWTSYENWCGFVVPWILEHAEPKADGGWSATHAVEVPWP